MFVPDFYFQNFPDGWKQSQIGHAMLNSGLIEYFFHLDIHSFHFIHDPERHAPDSFLLNLLPMRVRHAGDSAGRLCIYRIYQGTADGAGGGGCN